MAKFYNKDVRSLLNHKTVVVMGDSIQRSIYKDLVCMFKQEDCRFLYDVELRAKGEHVFQGDKLLSGGKFLVNSLGKMPNGTDYREVREFRQDNTVFRYYFLTRCFSEHMESILNELKTLEPDLIIMNSCLWDIHHYGSNSLLEYNENLPKLLKASLEALPSLSLFIWNATLPLAQKCKGGFLKPGFHSLPVEDIRTANKYAWTHVTQCSKGIYLDLYTELQQDLDVFIQAADGIHWGMKAHRKISNLIFEQVARKWGREIPHPPVPQFPIEENHSRMNDYYPLPQHTARGVEWNEVDEYDEEAPDYWNEFPAMYYPPTVLQHPNSGLAVDYKFYERPSLLGPGNSYFSPPNEPHPYFPRSNEASLSFPTFGRLYPGQIYWGTTPNPYAPRGQLEPPHKRMRFSDPLPLYGGANLSFTWNQNPFATQFYQQSQPTQQSEARYKGRLFNIKNKKNKRKRTVAGMPMSTVNTMGNRVNALSQSPSLNGSSTVTPSATVTNTSKSNNADLNNNPKLKPSELQLDEVKVDIEPRVGAGELHKTQEDAASVLEVKSESQLVTVSENEASNAEGLTSSDQSQSNSDTLVNGSTTKNPDHKAIVASPPKIVDRNVDGTGEEQGCRSDSEESQALKVGQVHDKAIAVSPPKIVDRNVDGTGEEQGRRSDSEESQALKVGQVHDKAIAVSPPKIADKNVDGTGEDQGCNRKRSDSEESQALKVGQVHDKANVASPPKIVDKSVDGTSEDQGNKRKRSDSEESKSLKVGQADDNANVASPPKIADKNVDRTVEDQGRKRKRSDSEESVSLKVGRADDKAIAVSPPKIADKNVDRISEDQGRKRKRSDSEESESLKVGRVDESSKSPRNTSFDGFI